MTAVIALIPRVEKNRFINFKFFCFKINDRLNVWMLTNFLINDDLTKIEKTLEALVLLLL